MQYAVTGVAVRNLYGAREELRGEGIEDPASLKSQTIRENWGSYRLETRIKNPEVSKVRKEEQWPR